MPQALASLALTLRPCGPPLPYMCGWTQPHISHAGHHSSADKLQRNAAKLGHLPGGLAELAGAGRLSGHLPVQAQRQQPSEHAAACARSVASWRPAGPPTGSGAVAALLATPAAVLAVPRCGTPSHRPFSGCALRACCGLDRLPYFNFQCYALSTPTAVNATCGEVCVTAGDVW